MKTEDLTVTGIEAWLRIARVAAIVVVVWATVLQVTVGVLIPPVLAVGVVFGALVPFLGRERRLAGLVAAFLGVAAVGGNVPSLLEELSHPSSAQAFIFTLVAASASVVLIGKRLLARPHSGTARPHRGLGRQPRRSPPHLHRPRAGNRHRDHGLKSQRVEFNAAPGHYAVFCRVVGHEDMTATLVVG